MYVWWKCVLHSVLVVAGQFCNWNSNRYTYSPMYCMQSQDVNMASQCYCYNEYIFERLNSETMWYSKYIEYNLMNKTRVNVLICVSYLDIILNMLWIYRIVTLELSKTPELIPYNIYSCLAIVTYPFVDTLARWNTTGGSFACREFFQAIYLKCASVLHEKMLHALHCLHGNVSF